MSNRLKIIYTPEEVHSLVNKIALAIETDYAAQTPPATDNPPVLIGALKGAFVFMSDLIKAMRMDVEVDFVQTTSYGRRDQPTTEVLITRDITSAIHDRDVIIVEGIVDRGHTAQALVDYLSSKGPASLKFCSFLVREGVERRVQVDYSGAMVGPGFVVGYGMDFKERFRGLGGIYVYEREEA
ncbi:MAG: hypothetical protein A3J24_04990 [Deltaproteobacteria bacterium RIFCSPLOWO2_02_FULL_53_8]|nr:MAG: hypothetical protein A3J24_04990 [Deltaproteobacteria bacterium RIFCSPLOWO2_02_FULL_53_8]